MRAFIRFLMMLSLCIHTIPLEEWDTLSKVEKKERLKSEVEFIKRELGCESPHIEVDIDSKYLYLYGECDNGKYIACNERRKVW